MYRVLAFVAPLLMMPAMALAAEYAPLNCDSAQTRSQKAICHSYKLGQDEARMATLYDVATSLVAMGQRGDIRDAQRAWIAEREGCGDDASCLAASYAKRIGALNGIISGIASRGPY